MEKQERNEASGRGGRGRGWKKGQGRGQKRREETDLELRVEDEALPSVDEASPVIQAFRQFQQELDAKYDKYERLVKHSRDATIQSKRVIFLLHRITSPDNATKILAEAEARIKEIQTTLLQEIALELIAEDFYCYLRAYTSGLQEYVEAVTFYFYIKDGRLISHEELQQQLFFNEQPEEAESDLMSGSQCCQFSLTLPPLEYALGIADLTGELMRRCINSVGQGNLEEPFVLCCFMRKIYDAMVGIGNQAGRELTRKLQVLRQSLQKVENACYTIRVRGSEMPKHMLVDAFSAGPSNSNFISEALDYDV